MNRRKLFATLAGIVVGGTAAQALPAPLPEKDFSEVYRMRQAILCHLAKGEEIEHIRVSDDFRHQVLEWHVEERRYIETGIFDGRMSVVLWDRVEYKDGIHMVRGLTAGKKWVIKLKEKPVFLHYDNTWVDYHANHSLRP